MRPSPSPLRRFVLRGAVAAGAVAIAFAGLQGGAMAGGAPPVRAPKPAYDPASAASTETAVLSGGCFWGLQGVFEHVRGVKSVLAGYSGGAAATAHYEIVGTETTGHAETVKVVFDPKVISYGEILRVYFSVATDPTQLDAQFPDQGSSYRGVVWFTTPAQKAIAQRYVTQLSAAHLYKRPIVTKIEPFRAFYKAEDYHQDYLLRHPDAAYIQAYDLPKVAALKAILPQDYSAKPVRAA